MATDLLSQNAPLIADLRANMTSQQFRMVLLPLLRNFFASSSGQSRLITLAQGLAQLLPMRGAQQECIRHFATIIQPARRSLFLQHALASAGVEVQALELQTSGHGEPGDLQLHQRPPADEGSHAAAKRQRTAQAQDVSSAPTSPQSPAPAAPPGVRLRNAARCQPPTGKPKMKEVDVTVECPAAQPDAQLRRDAHERLPAWTPVKPEQFELGLTLHSPGAQPPDAAQAPAGTLAVKNEELLLDLTLDLDDEEPAQVPDRQAELRPPARAATARLQSGTQGAQPSRESAAGMDRGPVPEQLPRPAQQQAQRSQGVPRHLERVAWEPLQARPAAEAGSHRAAAQQDSQQEPRSFQGRAPAKGAELRAQQKKRRAENAAFKQDGTTKQPCVGQAFPGTVKPQQRVGLEGGWDLCMPVNPNRSQLMLMKRVTAALRAGHHGLLESPTGTGKTLALLCAVAEWQWRVKQAALEQPRDLPPDQQLAVPRIIWGARTHAQLDHAIRELRRTHYRPLMSVLASRERFCLHPDIKIAPNKTEACEQATFIGRMDCTFLEHAEAIVYPQAPEHLQNFQAGGKLDTFDIEELVAEGSKGHICPYHASRDLLNEGASLIFLTYSQLFDPPVRSANGLDALLSGAVVVIDEGHNVAAECREAATLSLTLEELAALGKDVGSMKLSLNKMAAKDGQWTPHVQIAHAMGTLVGRITKWLRQEVKSNALEWSQAAVKAPADNDIKEIHCASGTRAFLTVTTSLQQTQQSVTKLQRELKQMRKGLIEGNFESRAVKSGAINQLESLLAKLLFVLKTKGVGYKQILLRSRGGPRGAIQAGSFAFLCLHAAVAMQPVASTTHSVLLTSGTLSPMEPLLAELGLDGSSLPQEAASRTQRHLGQPGAFPAASAAASPGPSTDAAQGSASARPGQPGPLLGSPGGPSGRSAAAAAGSGSRAGQPHQGLPQQQQQRSAAVRRASGPVPRTRLYFSSPHHSSLQGNLLALSISHVPRAGGVVKLNSGFQHRGSPEYLNGLGSVLLAACAPVPHGVLFFFPSWGLLHAATAQWKLSGLYETIQGLKTVVTEVQATGEAFEASIKLYKSKAVESRGAVFLAVMRGRSSEGVDFLDAAARAVIIVGLPFPPLHETTVRLKREFNSEHAAVLGTGDYWYDSEAFRAVNQAAGRLIRHAHDYGAVLLVDCRFSMTRYKAMLSPWLQANLTTNATIDSTSAHLHSFFRQKSQQQRQLLK